MTEVVRDHLSNGQESLTVIIRRIGHIAGVVAVSVLVFAFFYYWVLYLISE